MLSSGFYGVSDIFAEQSALMIVDKATDRLSLFELSEKGGNYRFEKDGDEVKLLAQ